MEGRAGGAEGAAGAPTPEFVSLERTLAPPLDAKGRPWRVEVLSEGEPGGEGSPVAVAAARRDGAWRHAKVPAGLRARLRVRTEDDDVWWVSPEPFDTSVVGPAGPIDLARILVEGIARVGKQPLPGLVTFRDEAGLEVRFVAGIDGEFEGALPRAGSWSVGVRSVRAGFDRMTEVDVEEAAGPRGEAPPPSFIDVHFADFAIRGDVADANGNPVERFTLAIRESGAATERWEENVGSTFRYDRIALGSYDLRIVAPWKSSPRFGVAVPDGDDPDFISAVVDDVKRFRGHVVSTTGQPIPGGVSRVMAVPEWGSFDGFFQPRGRRASFSARIAARAQVACAILYPPGHAVSITAREATAADHEFVVSSVGGALVLEAPLHPLRHPVLFRNGCAVRLDHLAFGLGALRDDRRSHVEVHVPLMAPGPYTLCSVTRRELGSFLQGDPTFPRCVSGALEPAEPGNSS